jgi:hypothetical protein
MGVWARGRRDADVRELTQPHTNAGSGITLLKRSAVAPRAGERLACLPPKRCKHGTRKIAAGDAATPPGRNRSVSRVCCRPEGRRSRPFVC